ncbi:xanthine dehydrogenase/oxidase-like [Ylistrum balloti]|uniref:xanthine dehydrogenase/oxidase-like n=1 Tax=Ylistrum balloti TaxID=509963 RepID=UPI002905D469|nr:xanthine dehydrogenase/oxidase-like [Ylistrum balloti]
MDVKSGPDMDCSIQETTALTFYVNGKKVVVPNPDPETTLLHFLRTNLRLTGTKLGCGEGGCGACTVMISKYNPSTNQVKHLSVNACLAPICSLHGLAVTTVEGIGSIKQGLHPIQEKIAKSHGSQCGFCTPGIVMSMYTLLRNIQNPTVEDMESAFEGNLCRCTGYRPIIEGFKDFTKGSCAMGKDCCRNQTKLNNNDCGQTVVNGYDSDVQECVEAAVRFRVFCVHAFLSSVRHLLYQWKLFREQLSSNYFTSVIEELVRVANASLNAIRGPIYVSKPERDLRDRCLAERMQSRLALPNTLASIIADEPDLSRRKKANCVMQNGDQQTDLLPTDSTQDPIFPPQLRTRVFDDQYLYYKGERSVWYRPTSLDQLLELKAVHPTARLIIGNTEVGVEIKLKNMHYPVMIAVTHIPELQRVVSNADGITIGASVTLAQLDQTLRAAISTLPEHQTGVFRAIVEMLRWFAGHQIRNVAAIGGNIMTASPISDLNPLFMAAGVMLHVASKGVEIRTLKMDENFFLGYRKTAVDSSEVLVSLTIPYTQQNEYFYGYKQAYRREDDIAIVNAGIRVLLEDSTIRDMSLAFGGMAPTTVMALNAMKQTIGRKWNDSFLNDMTGLLADDLPLAVGSPGGMTEYRRTLCVSFFFKFYLTVQLSLNKQHITNGSKVPSSYRSATDSFQKESIKSAQIFEEVAPGQPVEDTLGRPLNHLSAYKQATGEAIYVDDIPPYKDELILAFVFSTKSHAKLINVDPSVSLTMPGVVDFISFKDIPGQNMWGPIEHDEEFMASEKVVCMGQIVGAVIADSQTHAQRAAKAVQVKYEDLSPIITIKEAIAAKSYHGEPRVIERGNLREGFEMSDHIIEGEVHIGGQEHFYLETNAALAVPKYEDGEMEMFVSTQNPAETQMMVARALGIAENKIVIRVKRMGGGFGGKETRSVIYSIPVAVAAEKLGRPVKCMLDRDEDMLSSGCRHPFYGKFKVGFTKDARILALDLELYSNIGCSLDLSRPVMERAMFHCDGCYKIPNMRVTGRLCRTNIPSNTAFRGFGGPQGNFVSETYIADIAAALDMSPIKVREVNMYSEGDLTHFNQKLENCNIRRCWDECLQSSEANHRCCEVAIFNSENRWKKRGISVIPVKFGISFTAKFMNQAGALVMIYRDGSVLIAHGGTEMGQGLHTKMTQVACRALNISMSKIHISETSTNTIPNTSPTAASASSDLNGMAIKNACEILLERIEPYRSQNPKGTWEEWVTAAYFDRVSLSVSTFYKTPDLGYDFETNDGRVFNYFTFGAACSEVEIDCLTGDHKVLRTDIVMDVGTSLNPAIDIGQIEGAFTQGYGLMMMEQQKVSPDGFLFTRGPGAYKIPGFGDVPIEFNVSLLRSSFNSRAVYSSKAIGEPPLFLAASVFFAVKEAIRSARGDAEKSRIFQLNSPATPERIRMACEDQFTKQFPLPEEGSFKPWFVEL